MSATASLDSVIKGEGSSAPERHDVKRLLKRGSLFTMIGYGGGQALRLVSNLILWRLLYPEAFGLMMLVNAFMQGLAMFSDVGIGPSIVQSEHGEDPAFINTAWTVQVLRGVVLFVVGCAAAWPVAWFYGQPPLAPLVPVVAASALIGGLHSTKLFTATRRMALGRMTAVELGSQAAGLVVMVAIALAYPSVWALAWGGVAGTAIRSLATHLFLPGVNNRFQWDKNAAHALARFGRWIFASTLLTFLAINADRLIFGKFLTMQELGVYSIAAGLGMLPSFLLGHMISQVLFPLLSRARGDGAPMRAFYLDVRRPVLIAGAWMSACLLAGGPTLIHFLYDPKAEAAGWIIQALAIGAWCSALENSNSHAMLALGRPKWLAAANGAKVVGMAVLIPVGAIYAGFPGAMAGLVVADLFKYAVSAFAARRAGLGVVGQDLTLSAGVAGTALLGLAVRAATGRLGLAAIVARLGLPVRFEVKIAALLEGLAIFLAISAVWGGAFLALRRARARAAAAALPTGG